MFQLPAVQKPRFVSNVCSEENGKVSSPKGSAQHKIQRSKSQDLRRVLLTAKFSSCPDLVENKPNTCCACIKNSHRAESFDLLTSRLGGATQKSRALGIGLQRHSPRASTEGGSTRESPTLSKMCQNSSGHSTPVSSRRAAANSSCSKDSRSMDELAVSPPAASTDRDSPANVSSNLSPQADDPTEKPNLRSSRGTANSHIKLHRTIVRNNVNISDGNSRCSSSNTTSDQSDTPQVNVLKLTKENLTERTKLVSVGFVKERARLNIEPKKENRSFLKNLFGFKKKPFACNKECNTTAEEFTVGIPDTMTRAQYERCCRWLVEVEKAKNNRCIEVSATPPPIWSE